MNFGPKILSLCTEFGILRTERKRHDFFFLFQLVSQKPSDNLVSEYFLLHNQEKG